MVFILDKDFEKSLNGKPRIKIVYLDNSNTTWNLYVSENNKISCYGTVKGINDGQWKTATFTTDQKIKTGHLSDNASFIIELSGNEDVTIRHVRVLRPEL